jgi:hypothetical protein
MCSNLLEFPPSRLDEDLEGLAFHFLKRLGHLEPGHPLTARSAYSLLLSRSPIVSSVRMSTVSIRVAHRSPREVNEHKTALREVVLLGVLTVMIYSTLGGVPA